MDILVNFTKAELQTLSDALWKASIHTENSGESQKIMLLQQKIEVIKSLKS